MNGEIIQSIYSPTHNAEWVLVKTNNGLYSLRLGGFKKESYTDTILNHEEIEFPYRFHTIQEIYTDEEWVYLKLNGGGVIASGWIDVTFSGEMKLGVKFTKDVDYDSDFFKLDFMKKLQIGVDNWSHFIP